MLHKQPFLFLFIFFKMADLKCIPYVFDLPLNFFTYVLYLNKRVFLSTNRLLLLNYYLLINLLPILSLVSFGVTIERIVFFLMKVYKFGSLGIRVFYAF